jgi:hypothetical protein
MGSPRHLTSLQEEMLLCAKGVVEVGHSAAMKRAALIRQRNVEIDWNAGWEAGAADAMACDDAGELERDLFTPRVSPGARPLGRHLAPY